MSKSAWKLLDKGRRLGEEGKPEEAGDSFQEAVRRLKDSVGARIQWASFLIDQNRSAQAADLLTEAIEIDAKNPAPLLFLALAQSELGQSDAAVETVVRLESLCPNNQILPTLKTILQLRRVPLTQLKLPTDLCVSPTVLKALLLETERRLLPLEVTGLSRTAAPTEEEIDKFERPPTPSYLEQLRSLTKSLKGWACRKQGTRTVEAVFRARSAFGKEEAIGRACALLRLARSLEPTGFRSDYYLGEAQLLWSTPQPGQPYIAPRVRRARESFMRSRQRDGPNPYVHYYLGRSSQLLGEVVAAQDYYRRALARFEKLPEAHYGLGQCFLLTGDEAQAKHYLYRAVSSDLTLARERLRDLLRVFEIDSQLLQRELPTLPAEEESLTKGQQESENSPATLARDAGEAEDSEPSASQDDSQSSQPDS